MAMTTTAELFTAEQKAELARWKGYYPHPQMGIIEALRSVQQWHRHIPFEAERYLSELFELPLNHIHGLVTFFPAFTQEPTGKYRVGLCHGLSCWLAGSDKMAACLEKTLGVPEGKTTEDGRFSWEEMECLGACEQGPALLLNDRLQGAATPEAIEKLAKDLK